MGHGHQKNPPAPSEPRAASYVAGAFSKLAEAQALSLKVQSAPAFDFSEQTREALRLAGEDPSLENVGLAARLAAAELDGKPALGELAKTLSLAIAMPTPGAKGAGNVLYPAFGTGLAAVEGELGREAALVAFSSKEHEVEGVRAPLEAWARGERDAAPGAHWIERNARMALRGADLRDPEPEGRARDYLSARWPQMSGLVRSNSGAASLSGLLSLEAAQEDKKRVERDAEARGARAASGPGRRALERVLAVQRDLMGALEGAQAGQGVFEKAAQLWADRMAQEQAQREREAERSRGYGYGRHGGDVGLPELKRMSRFTLEAIDEDLWGEEGANLIIGLTREWMKEDLGEWLAQPQAKEGVWPAERVARFEQEMGKGGFLAEGKRAFEEGYGGFWRGGAAEGVCRVFAASVYAVLSPPLENEEARALKARRASDTLRGMTHELMHRMHGGRGPRGFFGQFGGMFELPMMMAEWAEGALRAKAGMSLQSAKPELSKSAQEAAWEGIEELLGLGDQCVLEAARLAREREIAALESMGLPASAKAEREDETGHGANLPWLAAQEAKRRASEQTDMMSKALGLRAQMLAGAAEGRLERSMKAHAKHAGSKAELEAFFKSPMGAVYASVLEMAWEEAAPAALEAACEMVFLACLREFRDPAPSAHPLNDHPMSEASKERFKAVFKRAVSSGQEWEWKGVAYQIAQLSQDRADRSWLTALGVLGAEEGVAFLAEREQACNLQRPMAARWLVERAMGLAPRDKAPLPPDSRPLKKDDCAFMSLPYGHAPDAALRARCSKGLSQESDFEDQAVARILREEGFAGEAALAAKLAYGEIETRPGADDRSRANAWLAAGKRLCKEELGLTEASYQAARAHAATGKRLAGLLPRVVKAKAAERERSQSAVSGPGLPAAARKAARLAELLGSALSRSMPANRGYVAAEAIEPGRASSGDLDITWEYLNKAFEPLGAGASRVEVFNELRREMAAKKALKERFEGALLERSDELLKGFEADGKSESAAEKAAIAALRRDLERVDDWAADRAGAFFTGLHPKLRWAHLRRGEEEWHQEAVLRKASVGSGWEAALGSWADKGGEWTAKELVTPEELSREGAAMRHCVGGYSSQCRDGGSRIFSISKNGVRALTAQFTASEIKSVEGQLPVAASQWKLAQNKGPCNAEPTKEGAKMTRALQEALQAGWDERVEQKAKRAAQAWGEIKTEAGAGEFEIPGFNPDTALDLSRLRRARAAKAPEPACAEGKEGPIAKSVDKKGVKKRG